MTENIVGKGEDAGPQHFLLFAQCLQKAPRGPIKFGLSGEEIVVV